MKSGNVYEEVGNVGANVTTYWQTDVGQGTYYFYVRAPRRMANLPRPPLSPFMPIRLGEGSSLNS